MKPTPHYLKTPQGRVVPGLLVVGALCAVAAGGMAARYGPSWPRRLYWPRPPGVVIHHSASPGTARGRTVDVHVLDTWHEARGWGQETFSDSYHIGYHYVILPDGTVQTGRPEWMQGAHCRSHNNYLGVCLVGNFSSIANPRGEMQPSRPTEKQMISLRALLKDLTKRYHFSKDDVLRHRDLGQTECPGDRFDLDRALGNPDVTSDQAES